MARLLGVGVWLKSNMQQSPRHCKNEVFKSLFQSRVASNSAVSARRPSSSCVLFLSQAIPAITQTFLLIDVASYCLYSSTFDKSVKIVLVDITLTSKFPITKLCNVSTYKTIDTMLYFTSVIWPPVSYIGNIWLSDRK